jgi:hypothetical protein
MGQRGVRLNPRHQDMVRQKIQASQIVNRLQNHVDGKVELSATQVQAARILLDRSLPTLTSTELTGKDGAPVEATVRFVKAD